MVKTIGIILLAGLVIALPASAVQADRHFAQVVVRVEDTALVSRIVLMRAQIAAARMIASAGVRVEWTNRKPARRDGLTCDQTRRQEVLVRLVPGKIRTASSEAFAMAAPYASSGIRVTIFHGEVVRASGRQFRLESAILAHVLAHEITHVIEGIVRHSDTGIMRAHWTASELNAMEEKPLLFADVDRELIRNQLARAQVDACDATTSGSSIPGVQQNSDLRLPSPRRRNGPLEDCHGRGRFPTSLSPAPMEVPSQCAL